ncbi:MAG: ribosome recycling factor [Rickettsiales bacterium]|nr:ribosome recycling factor [Rickettsiales bacterium]
MENILNSTKSLMEKAIESLKRDLGTVSTGRANPSLLDTVKVESYGSYMPLKQVASVSVSDSSTIVVQAWDKGTVSHIEKAIIAANLGLNPMVDGMLIRINIPKLSEERRKELCKIVKRYGEDKKIAIRNARKDGLESIKKVAKEFSEDLVRDNEGKIQEFTDKYCKMVDDLVSIKEKDLLTL